MSISSHCLTTGSLGTGQMPTPGLGNRVSVISTASPGNRRGVVVAMDGFQTVSTIPVPFVNITNANYWLTFANDLASQGWVVIQPTYHSHLNSVGMTTGVYNDVFNDSGHGSRLLNDVVNIWWDHVLQWIGLNYGTGFPIVAFGMSWGGWHSMNIAAYRSSTIVAYGAHCPVTILSNTNLVEPITNALNSTGLDSGQHLLDNVTLPGVIGYHTNDIIVGWSQTSSPVSNTDLIITNQQSAQPSHQVIRNSATTGNHAFLTIDETYYAGTWFPTYVNPLCPANL